MKPALTAEEQARKDKHVVFTKAFCAQFFDRFKRAYVHQGAKDASPLKQFILNAPDVTVEDWTHVAKSVWNGGNIWMRNNVVTIAILCSQWNQAQVQAPPRPKPKSGDVW